MEFTDTDRKSLFWIRDLPMRERYYAERHDTLRRKPSVIILTVKDDESRTCCCGNLAEMCCMTCKQAFCRVMEQVTGLNNE